MGRDDSQVDPFSKTAARAAEQAAHRRGRARGGADEAATVQGRPRGAKPVPPPGLTATDGAQPSRPEAPTGDLVGARLAHFRVERRLGKGGMGEVYLATDLALDRPVALKFLPREIGRDPRLKERFYREARAQARIAHPNVCHIYFIGEEDEQLFFAMEYIDGESLQDKLDREGAIDPHEAIEFARMAALGLREAHRHGFTHRDIKPSNLMVDRHGTVKVVDFGIVKKAPEGGDASLTSEGGGLIGTPLYMAPEQAKGESVDFRADVYALGATLHHLLSGQPPFRGDTPLSIVSQHLSEPRPRLEVRARQRRRRAALDALCDRMMAKRPEGRPSSYEALVGAFDRVAPDRARPAGFWVRAFAAGMDTFALLLILAVMALPLQLLAGVGQEVNSSVDDGVFLVAAALYGIVSHARWGRTLGKLALEIRVVPESGTGPPGWKRAGIRFLVQWGPLYLALGVATLLAETRTPEWLVAVVAITGFALPAIAGAVGTSILPGKQTPWDRAAGTDVRYVARPRLT